MKHVSSLFVTSSILGWSASAFACGSSTSIDSIVMAAVPLSAPFAIFAALVLLARRKAWSLGWLDLAVRTFVAYAIALGAFTAAAVATFETSAWFSAHAWFGSIDLSWRRTVPIVAGTLLPTMAYILWIRAGRFARRDDV